MCVTCGCSDDNNTTITNMENQHSHTHTLPDGTVITHSHDHHHHESPANVHAKIHNTTISLEQEILGKNNLLAAQNRGWFKGRNILALNLMSSPGAGKTT
ncbi:MAG: hydrogenase accessory protein HypB, partial [Sphaerospermopsis kisseleviana]